MTTNQSEARIDNSISLPDYFSCQHCPAGRHSYGEMCGEFQRAGRCRAAILAQAVASGQVQIHLHIPAGRLPG